VEALLKKEYIILDAPTNHQAEPDFQLNSEQQKVLGRIKGNIASGRNEEMLLYGVTGSGKTEVYIEAARAVIRNSRTAIILVPEIALTKHLVKVFSERFEKMAVLHSGLSKGERWSQWQRIKSGEVELVLGTRSAVFAPLENIGLIVIDEEQENTYKQEETPRYHAREVAAFRAHQDKALLILGSATPSVESFHKTTTGEMELVTLTQRTGTAVLPEVTVVDLKDSIRHDYSILSADLLEKIRITISKGEQAILFINRRGYTPVTICMDCGQTVVCPNCSVALN
jgi:primosomal protein N' (replication factor Y)